MVISEPLYAKAVHVKQASPAPSRHSYSSTSSSSSSSTEAGLSVNRVVELEEKVEVTRLEEPDEVIVPMVESPDTSDSEDEMIVVEHSKKKDSIEQVY